MEADGTTTWRRLLREADDRLLAAGLPSPAVDARRIVERASGWEGAQHALHLDDAPTERAVAHFDVMLARRAGGEPLQYVLGRWGFRTLDLYIDARVLIPRPETEAVVEVALEELARLRRPRLPLTVVDLGTGSGAIALAVATEVLDAHVWGVDRSADALAVARANLTGVGRPATRVTLVEGDWFAALPTDLEGEVDLVVANPPYVAEGDDLPAEVSEWEPRQALIAGPTGLEDVTAILAAAPAWLARPGVVVVELAPHHAADAADLARAAGFTYVDVRPDYTGRDRALVARIDAPR